MKQNYFGIQTTFIIGVVLSVAIIKYAIGFNNFMVLFWDVRSIIIVLGGVLAATHMHFTDAQFFKLFGTHYFCGGLEAPEGPPGRGKSSVFAPSAPRFPLTVPASESLQFYN